jgi:hypothetical protein
MACSVLTIRQYHSTSLRRSPGINFVKLIFHRQKSGKKGREPVIGDVEILQLLLELLEAAEGEAEEPIPGDAKKKGVCGSHNFTKVLAIVADDDKVASCEKKKRELTRTRPCGRRTTY